MTTLLRNSVFAILLTPLSLFAADRVLVQVPATLAPAAPVPAAVKRDCGLEQLVGNYTLDGMGRRGTNTASVSPVDPAGTDKVIHLTILAVHGYGGGSWSGPKSMVLKAELRQDGKSLATRVFTRGSRGGAFGGLSGTCGILDRVAGALGKDVAAWVASGMMLSSTGGVTNVPEQGGGPPAQEESDK